MIIETTHCHIITEIITKDFSYDFFSCNDFFKGIITIPK